MNYKIPIKIDLKVRTSMISNTFANSVTPYIILSEKVKRLKLRSEYQGRAI